MPRQRRRSESVDGSSQVRSHFIAPGFYRYSTRMTAQCDKLVRDQIPGPLPSLYPTFTVSGGGELSEVSPTLEWTVGYRLQPRSAVALAVQPCWVF